MNKYRHYLILLLTFLGAFCTSTELMAATNINDNNETIMYTWIEAMTTCPRADKNRYPQLNPDAVALFKKATEADKDIPKTLPQDEIKSNDYMIKAAQAGDADFFVLFRP
jgi:hypothetical protein